jgi:peptide/nickel transport system substrate-binding protein
VADSWVHPKFPYFPQVEPALTRHTYDQRRASALLAEAGWQKGPDGLVAKGAEKFNVQIRYRDNETEATIIREAWKQLGVEGQLEHLSDQMLRDHAGRAQFSGFDVSNNPMGGLSAIRRLESVAVPTADNRWSGTNRGGYTNPAFDAVGDRFRVALEESQRVDLEKELVRIFSQDVPLLPLYYEIQSVPVGGGLTGVQSIIGIAHTGHVMHTWNVHEWDLQKPQS